MNKKLLTRYFTLLLAAVLFCGPLAWNAAAITSASVKIGGSSASTVTIPSQAKPKISKSIASTIMVRKPGILTPHMRTIIKITKSAIMQIIDQAQIL